MKEQTNTTEKTVKFIRPELFRVGAIFGVIASLLCISYTLLLYGLDLNAFGKWKYIYFPIYGLTFAGAMSYFRIKLNNGRMQGPQGVIIGMTLNLIASTIYGILLQVILSTEKMGREIIERHATELKMMMVEGKTQIIETLGETEYNAQIEKLGQLSADTLAVDQAIGMLMFGVFATFLFMLITKQK
ncbi:DUF4199 family protein [Flammeovirga yaeyamensis]|uniref:DUF4199 family protein n=1 Tax=Flammeovirga yaeyamensis TaxID=367791 RepID=A0AAX1N4F7_9BACT|nr:DUF4199 domain-containing protein [Flammeovirga yaeyamensis]MBB3701417.1 hypothetical protein [Flammeovirga yaeyamensis]NMF38551.1 DUF4199 domain-containing protein [Flammeovirga yaeyamensis]QWG02370.1 DUF4199 family protein [Flammeovirga yaeyamensis]